MLDVPAYELRRQGRSVRLERRPMELLLLLVDRRGEHITRDEIVARLWGRDVFIDIDTSDNTAIRKIRRALTSNDQFSTTAKNIKIMTVNGKVTLRGPVQNEQEKQAIASLAENVAGKESVDNQLELKTTNQ